MSEEAAGYAVLAERRTVHTGADGGIVVVDVGGATALDHVNPAAYYRSGADPDEAYAVAQAGSGPEQCRDLRDSGQCIAGLEKRVRALEDLVANLAMQVSALQTDLLAAQTVNAYMEHRVSELERAASAQEGEL